MKVFFYSFLAFFTILLSSSTFAHQELLIEERGGRPVRAVKVVLDGEHFVVVSPSEDGGATLEELTRKVGGKISMNGTFFCPDDYSYCKVDRKKRTHTISERVFKGDGKSWSRFWWDTSVRAIFSFDKQGKPFLVQKNSGNHDVGLRSDINKDRLEDIYFWIGNFPVLLLEGENMVQASVVQFDENPKMRNAVANRHFICSTEDQSTIYFGVIGGLDIRKMPDYLKKNFDCRNALFLDGGYSAAMIYEDKLLESKPRKRIMDAVVVLTREEYQNLTGLEPATPNIEKVISYQPTQKDQQQFDMITSAIDKIFEKYGKKNYKLPLIKLIRKMVNPDLELEKKWLYNQVLIYLYTLEDLSENGTKESLWDPLQELSEEASEPTL